MGKRKGKEVVNYDSSEEDVPFVMPDLPEYYSSERNVLSLIGKTLNPEYQIMKNLIAEMPRKWQKVGRVRGIALAKDRFQFIFKYEHDLLEELEKGMHTYNDWSLAIDRWVEIPPPDYLRFVPTWVQMRNVPVNHYTKEALTTLGEFAGEVMTVAFDPSQAQYMEYVRVRVKLDTEKPLRKSKLISLRHGETTTIYYHYERVQRRCTRCQRLTHAADKCPRILRNSDKESTEMQRKEKAVEKILEDTDPLFGILSEEQVNVDKATGRRKIADEVLNQMRDYLVANNGEDMRVKMKRIQQTVEDAEKSPLLAKSVLRLEL